MSRSLDLSFNCSPRIFFYPSAGTPVCTKEACGFRDSLSSKDVYKDAKVEIVGISADSVTKNKAWAEQHNLNVSFQSRLTTFCIPDALSQFTLLSDIDRKVRKEYQVSNAMLGLIDGIYFAALSRRVSEFRCTGRYTFCIDSEGYLRGVESSTLSARYVIKFRLLNSFIHTSAVPITPLWTIGSRVFRSSGATTQ